MAKLSKRQFLKSFFLLSVPGGASLLAPLTAGCNRGGEEPTAPENRTDRPQAQPRPESKSVARISPDFQPAYLRLHETGELKKRADDLWKIMESCELCPRMCGVNKLEGNKGFCQASAQLQISSYHPHFGEERPLVGKGGSGTIFLTNCGLRCVFCINWEVSQGGQGRDRDVEDMANMMIRLQERGCHNINVVTPTHYSPHIVRALDIAAGKGLRLPLVYNTCGWERVEILKMLDGIVDIYLPDFKYADGKMAAKYSSDAETYPEVTKAALLEMHRQVGVAKPAEDGLMYRGLMIRHLVMPNRVSGTQEVFRWIGENLPKDTYLNIMAQYRPMYKASEYPDIARRLTRQEYSEAVGWAREAGLTNLDIQGAAFRRTVPIVISPKS